MKKSFYERIESMLKRILERIAMLERNIEQYAEEGNFEDAAKCQTKRDTFLLVANDLRKELYNF